MQPSEVHPRAHILCANYVSVPAHATKRVVFFLHGILSFSVCLSSQSLAKIEGRASWLRLKRGSKYVEKGASARPSIDTGVDSAEIQQREG